MDDRKIINRNIKAERVRAGLTQEEVANILGIERKTYINIEKENKVEASIMFKLSVLFNCPIDNFYMGYKTTIGGK